MTTKFKVGDKVKCIEQYEHETPPVRGEVYTVERIETGFTWDLLSLEGVKGGHYAYRFDLVTPGFKVGDRVAVAFENTISSIVGDNAYFDNGLATTAAPLSSLTKLTEPIPTAGKTVIRTGNGRIFEHGSMLEGWWTLGLHASFDNAEVQSIADAHGFSVIYAGDK